MSRRGMYSLMAMSALLMAAAQEPNLFMHRQQNPKPKKREPKVRTEEERAALQKAYEYKSEKEKHDFYIHGELIRAKDKKTAIKIYNNQYKNGIKHKGHK